MIIQLLLLLRLMQRLHLQMESLSRMQHFIVNLLVRLSRMQHFTVNLLVSLIYLTVTRPNIAHVVHLVSQFIANPQTLHSVAVLCIICYLKDLFFNSYFFLKNLHPNYELFHMLIGPGMLMIVALQLDIVCLEIR